MYKEFYGFTTYPFAPTPDPEFLYPSESYKDCLVHLLHGLEQGEEFLILTGEIGTGKTFLLNTLVKSLDETIPVTILVYSNLEPFGILQYVAQEFHLERAGKSKAELVMDLKGFLESHATRREKVVLIIDEAQNLSVEVLEDLRLLSNFGNPEQPWLQIILAGQPQLEAMLRLPELPQLSQRIGYSCRLRPMHYEETKLYIEKRLAVAGATYPLFTSKALKKIFVGSRGIPRAVNLICHFALVSGVSHAERKIGSARIKQVMKELNLYRSEPPLSYPPRQKRDMNRVHVHGVRRPSRLALVAGIAAFGLLGAGVVLHSSLTSSKLSEDMTRVVQRPPPLLPLGPVVREAPLLPLSPVVREAPKSVQWAQTTLSYQLPTGEPLTVPLPPLHHTPEDVPVKVTLDASDSTPIWLTFDPETLALSGTAPPTETGKAYHLTFRAQTAHGPASPLHLVLTLIAQTRPSLALPLKASGQRQSLTPLEEKCLLEKLKGNPCEDN